MSVWKRYHQFYLNNKMVLEVEFCLWQRSGRPSPSRFLWFYGYFFTSPHLRHFWFWSEKREVVANLVHAYIVGQKSKYIATNEFKNSCKNIFLQRMSYSKKTCTFFLDQALYITNAICSSCRDQDLYTVQNWIIKNSAKR